MSDLDSWDSDARFSRYALIGLSRHADHHARAAQPFHLLRIAAESPRLPGGYFVTTVAVLFNNEAYRAYAESELRQKRLGPFREQPRAA